jgi:hypothetical protein
LSDDGVAASAWAYYFFSIQFRENLEAARQLYPNDDRLLKLEQGECDTDNLSPWPDVADAGERMNHDEFMRRLLRLRPLPDERRQQLIARGEHYLSEVRRFDALTKALSLTTYEDGGLERVFRAMLRSPESPDPLIRAFRHFLSEHVKFDSDPDEGHGALIRHIEPDDRVLPLWLGFKNILLACVPGLATRAEQRAGALAAD